MSESMKHLIQWSDWPDQDVRAILELALEIKRNRHSYAQKLKARTLVMLFQKTSTRTRVSFEAGMTELGGHAIYLNWASTNFQLTRIEYETAYLSRNAALLMARLKEHQDLLEMASAATIPVINGCCNRYHPCQAMADMLTILEDRGSVEGARLTYIGVHNNVANSLMATSAALGVHLTLVCPIKPEQTVDQEVRARLQSRGLLTEELDARAAVERADYVYTDTWVDMEFFNDPAYQEMKEERLHLMLPYQLNAELLKNSKAKVLHDMPIHPGYEIDGALVNDKRSLIFAQAENRLHAQKAIMLRLLAYEGLALN